ncbi:hypothetical protein LCGC14_3135380 [marine sediment metagenome]|uniref:Uncharacterized protein n=1 Tax=marine sediment metagenome TaxID=412755 RepID=A0A0F8VYI9_9ZZZZ
MIQPTVGRIVYYYCLDHEKFGYIEAWDRKSPLAAIIAHVWPNGRVNLAVFDVNGDSHSRISVPLIQPGSERPVDGHFCEWMPYQVKKETGSESGEKEAGTQEI